MTPVVSIVTPCFNAERFLDETIRSVRAQTLEDWEWIIVDDGSTDASAEVIRGHLDDPRIRYVHKENSGVADTRNFGLARAAGRYLALLDADDVWTAGNLEEKVAALEENPSAMWCYSDLVTFSTHTGEEAVVAAAKEGLLEKYLLHDGIPVPAACSNMVFRRRCLDDGLSFDVGLSTSADRDFVTRFARHFEHVHLPAPLLRYRITAGSMSTDVEAVERDHVLMLRKYREMGIFPSWRFRRRCFANHYLVVAGSWWVDGNRKGRALRFMALAVLAYPPSVTGLVRRLVARVTGSGRGRGQP